MAVLKEPSREWVEDHIREFLRRDGQEDLFNKGMIDLFLEDRRREEARLSRYRPKHLVKDKDGNITMKEASSTGYWKRMTLPDNRSQ